MRFWNRWKLLGGYLARRERLSALPVEYIVETTAKCNLYCPMCVREILPQPKADMAEDIFERLVRESGHTAELMMLIGLGEPFLDKRIFDRIESCRRHNIHTLLSTNGTFLDEAKGRRLLETGLEHVTLSFDGATKESFEYYRKGAHFEQVRDNFVRFANLKAELGARTEITVQMIRMEKNWNEVDDFLAFWKGVKGVDLVRIKEDETTLLRPAAHEASDWKYPCHYLWRGPMYVKQDGNVYPCCQSIMLGAEPLGHLSQTSLPEIWNSEEMRRMRRLHACGRAGEIDVCSRCTTTIPHPALVVGSLILHGKWVRYAIPLVERLAYLTRLGRGWLRPAKRDQKVTSSPQPAEVPEADTTDKVSSRRP